ncbi:MAG: hypothetical protein ACR2KK_11365 [Acidimicrobiales bacterium]
MRTLAVNGLDLAVSVADERVALELTIPARGGGPPTTMIIGLGPDPIVARTILYSVRPE